MKYIRTKDGIYKSKRKCIEKDCLVIGEKENRKLGLVKKDIVAQADTIEELIMPNDLLFFADNNGNKIPVYVDNLNLLKSWISTHDIYKISKLYIKVGNDYKCVAKMNEKGALELL